MSKFHSAAVAKWSWYTATVCVLEEVIRLQRKSKKMDNLQEKEVEDFGIDKIDKGDKLAVKEMGGKQSRNNDLFIYGFGRCI